MGGGWLRDDSGQVIHIHVPLSPSSIVVPAQGRWYSVEKPTGPGAYHRIYDRSPAGWLPKTRISSGTLVSNKWISYLYLCPASTAGDSNDCKQTNRTRVIARTRALVRQRPTRPIEQIVCYCAYDHSLSSLLLLARSLSRLLAYQPSCAISPNVGSFRQAQWMRHVIATVSTAIYRNQRRSQGALLMKPRET